MNIFYTSHNPKQCAKDHCKVHVRKMIVEYAQLLSTAHRVIDGELEIVYTESLDADNNVIYRKKKWYTLASDTFKQVGDKKVLVSYNYYAATHINHPSAVWVRESVHHYQWLECLFTALCNLYSHNEGKSHKTSEKAYILSLMPSDISYSGGGKNPPQCMPEEFQQESTTKAYKDYLSAKYSEWQSRERKIKVEFYNA